MPTGFLFATIRSGGRDYRYTIYIPREYPEQERSPLIVFLHGAGECGRDGIRQITEGLGPQIMQNPSVWSFVVIFPQKPDSRDAWGDHEAAVMAMLRETEGNYRIDPDRRYLTGLSQGGNGTFVFGARHAGTWAALAAICGYGDPALLVNGLKKTPLWVFHGEADEVVPAEQSKRMAREVQTAGGSVRLTLYPGVGHNSWDRAYGESLSAWLLSHRRPVGESESG